MNRQADCSALIVHHKTFDQVFLKRLRCPLAELRASRRANAIADSENGFEVVMVYLSGNLTFSFLANYPEFPDG